MSIIDIILIVCIGRAIGLAIKHMKKNKGSCCGDCSQCSSGCTDCRKEE